MSWSVGVSYPLEDLFPSDILQPRVQVAHALRYVGHLALVGALDIARLADREVEGQLDAAVGVQGAEPALAAGARGRREADAVLASVGGAECEAAGGAATLRDHTVVIVKDLLLMQYMVSNQWLGRVF